MRCDVRDVSKSNRKLLASPTSSSICANTSLKSAAAAAVDASACVCVCMFNRSSALFAMHHNIKYNVQCRHSYHIGCHQNDFNMYTNPESISYVLQECVLNVQPQQSLICVTAKSEQCLKLKQSHASFFSIHSSLRIHS